MDTIGKRIIANRKRLKLTQEQLAEKLGVTAQAVSKWENDQSCPDIGTLPQLADIFNITIDSLLGRQEQSVYSTEIVDTSSKANGESPEEDAPQHGFEMTLNPGKKDAIGLGTFVLFSGILYLLSQLLSWDISFWNILWPSAFIFFGAWGLYPKFSFLRLGCLGIGLYFLADKIFNLSFQLDNKFIVAILIILFGVAMIVDGSKKNKKTEFSVTYTDKFGKVHHGKAMSSYECDNESFSCSASFSNIFQTVELDSLRYGEISTSFGEQTVDLSQIKTVHKDTSIDISCSFGELTVLIPKRFKVNVDSSASFGDVQIQGQPENIISGIISVSASVSFGETIIQYI